jgi:hypothetical protein
MKQFISDSIFAAYAKAREFGLRVERPTSHTWYEPIENHPKAKYGIV